MLTGVVMAAHGFIMGSRRKRLERQFTGKALPSNEPEPELTS
jgi:hypothetical protein